MAGRRDILNEAQSEAEQKPEEGVSDVEEIESSTDSSSEEEGWVDDREQLTQRMPPELLERVDTVKDRLGMTRNGTINLLVEQGLDNWE